VSISISKKIVHLTRVATGGAVGFKTEGDVLIYPSQTSVAIEVGTLLEKAAVAVDILDCL
jgi:hypothetical protein